LAGIPSVHQLVLGRKGSLLLTSAPKGNSKSQ
jgi:hypothetical protein